MFEISQKSYSISIENIENPISLNNDHEIMMLYTYSILIIYAALNEINDQLSYFFSFHILKSRSMFILYVLFIESLFYKSPCQLPNLNRPLFS